MKFLDINPKPIPPKHESSK